MKKIAIACQGGGSQTAFTAGVLQGLFEAKIQEKYQIVSLSGTSGGAVCATLAWYSLIKASQGDRTPLGDRLLAFWRDNSPQSFFEECFNDYLIHSVRMMDYGMMPRWAMSPASMISKAMFAASTLVISREEFYDFRKLLQTHIAFDEIKSWNRPASPVLVIGAANVLNGKFEKFCSRAEDIQVDHILASAAVPTIFPAVPIGQDAYWDGLFSDNPPTDELLDPDLIGEENMPDEIWVIQINPESCSRVPETPEDVEDRQNEMIGNESLGQGRERIELINKFIEQGAFTEKFCKRYKHVEVRDPIVMSAALQQSLDYATKLDRSCKSLGRLIEDGQRQAAAFVAQLPAAAVSEAPAS